jgi:predicted metal-dependent hydrolase
MDLGEIPIEVSFKDIKNVHLSVNPPNGSVRISAPRRMTLNTIRVFAISKLGWIKQQQVKLKEQERETPREYLNRESHYLWGKRYLLRVIEHDHSPSIELQHSRLLLRVPVGTDQQKMQLIVAQWYRNQIKTAIRPVITRWASIMGVEVSGFHVQRMKTKWGSCNHITGTIRVNTELAKKPKECLEYIVVHEMVHLIEPTHNRRFISIMDRFMPNWRFQRDQLNSLPVGHEEWHCDSAQIAHPR